MQVMVMCDQKVREMKARCFREGGVLHFVTVSESPKNGSERFDWDELCMQFLTNGNCIVVCSMEFAIYLARVKERLDKYNELLSEAIEKSRLRLHELADALAAGKRV